MKLTFWNMVFIMAVTADNAACSDHLLDFSAGPNFGDNFKHIGFEVSIYDSYIWNQNDSSNNPYKLGITFEGMIKREGAGKQFGVGAEYFLIAHDFSSKKYPDLNILLKLLLPNPQVVISRYSDNEFGISTRLFWVLFMAIPYWEYDFKQRYFMAGFMIKIPILLPFRG
jgi:hypothetical protein